MKKKKKVNEWFEMHNSSPMIFSYLFCVGFSERNSNYKVDVILDMLSVAVIGTKCEVKQS